jgi:hypothetical protein
MGVLKHVLNVLSPEVAADADTVPRETVTTQRARISNKRNSPPNADEEQAERRAIKKYRESMEATLKDIGEGLRGGNIVRSIAALRKAIGNEEDKLQILKWRSLKCSSEDEKVMCDELMAHHADRLADYTDEMDELKERQKKY